MNTSSAAFYRSSIGRKWIVAITGLILLAFVVGHMLGNLQIFWGPDQLNSYAVHLRDLSPLLWVVRIVLIVCFVTHIITTISLAKENRAARPVKYVYQNTKRATVASRTMLISGLIVFCFVIFHLLQFTFGWIDSHNAQLMEHMQDPRLGPDRHDVYRMVIGGFNHWSVSFFYLFGIGLLCFHLDHGFQSVFQTLGLRQRRIAGCLTNLSHSVAVVIFLGYCIIPASVMIGFLNDNSHPFGPQIPSTEKVTPITLNTK